MSTWSQPVSPHPVGSSGPAAARDRIPTLAQVSTSILARAMPIGTGPCEPFCQDDPGLTSPWERPNPAPVSRRRLSTFCRRRCGGGAGSSALEGPAGTRTCDPRRSTKGSRCRCGDNGWSQPRHHGLPLRRDRSEADPRGYQSCPCVLVSAPTAVIRLMAQASFTVWQGCGNPTPLRCDSTRHIVTAV